MKTTNLLLVVIACIIAVATINGVNAAVVFNSSSQVNFWFDFTTGSGTTAYDSSGHVNGVITAGTAWSSQKPSGLTGSINISRAGNQYVSVYAPSTWTNLSTTNRDYTVIAWIRPENDNTVLSSVYGNYNVTNGNVYAGGAIAATGYAQGYVTQPGVNAYSISNNQGPVWNLFITIFDGTSGTKTIKQYTNTTNGTPAVVSSFHTREKDSPLTIGYDAAYGAGNNFNGTIAQFAIINASINSSQITCLFNSGAGINYSNFVTNCLPSGATTNLSITALDAYNSTAISIFNASITINGTTTNYTTTTGTISTNIIQSSNANLANITITAQNYFINTTLNYNISTNMISKNVPYTIIRAFVYPANSTAVTNFTVNYTNYENTSETSSTTTTNGYVYIPLFNASYNVTIYNIFNGTINFALSSANLTANPYLSGYNFSLFTTNTLFFNIFDEQTLNRINQTVNLNLVGSDTQYNFSTSTGYYNATILNPQQYFITVSSNGYFTRTYIYNLINQTAANQTIYLLNSSTNNTGFQTTFTITDLSAIPLENTLITSQKLINNTFITVSSLLTDFAGQAITSYDSTQYYTITFSKNGYVTKSVTLKPVSTSYTVRLNSTSSANFISQMGDITYGFQPTDLFINPVVYNFNFTTSSPSARISSFGIRYDGIQYNSTGNTGGRVNITLNLSNVTNYQNFIFTYFITDINGVTYNFTNTYTVFDKNTPTNSSISQAITNAKFSTGGGIILAIIITVIVLAALSTFIVGALLGVVLGVLAITLSALTLIPWSFGIMIALIMFFSAWARGR